MVVLDAAGKVLSVNPAWQTFAREHGVAGADDALGQRYLELSAPLLSPAAAAGVRRVLNGEVAGWDHVDRWDGPQGTVPARASWSRLRVWRMPARTELIVSHEDVTGCHDAFVRAAGQGGQLSAVFDRMTEACFSVDPAWRFVAVNPQAATLLQRPVEELLGAELWQLFPELLGTEADRLYHQAMREAQPVSFELYFPPLNGWFQVRAYPAAAGLTVHFYDVSAQKREAQAQLDRNAVLEMTVLGRPLPEILAHLVRMVEGRLPGFSCAVLLDDSGRLRVAASGTVPPGVQQAMDDLEVRNAASPFGQAVDRAVCVVSEDLRRDPACRALWPVLAETPLRSCVVLPILDGEGEALGALTLFGTRPGPFPAEVLTELDKAQSLAAVAIEHLQMAERLTHRARHDALTGLPNRVLFAERLQASVDAFVRTGVPMSLLFLDVDGFKGINDSFGHEVGDQVLQEIASRLQAAVQPGETLARISGDEFTVILPHGGEAEAVLTARRCLQVFDRPFVIRDREVYLSVSIGVSVTPGAGTDADTLRRHADLAMYHAKSRRIGWAVFEPSFNARVSERFELSSALRRAVEQHELEVYYQPQHALRDEALVAVEALLRWRHPVLGTVLPEQFIPVAEETGLIVPLGAWAIRQVCLQGARWQAAGHAHTRIAVNVSALQFERDDFVATVQQCLLDTGFPASYLELELTERLVMRDVDASVRRMQELRSLGVRLAVDDFGTGYSSLSYLPRLPLNTLKIDRAFITGLSAVSVNYPVVKAILSLAGSVGLTTIAEGIETPGELQVLRDLGCSLGQGHLFSRAVPASEVVWPDTQPGPLRRAVSPQP